VSKHWRLGGLLLLVGVAATCDDGGTTSATFDPPASDGGENEDEGDDTAEDEESSADDEEGGSENSSEPGDEGEVDDEAESEAGEEEDSTSGADASTSGNADDEDDEEGDPAGDDEGTTSSSSSGAVTTEFETLEPQGTEEEIDPTNTSEDTNATGDEEVPKADLDIIDDLDDGDSVIYETADGRIGVWYVYDDEDTATLSTANPAAHTDFVPTPGGPNDSLFSAHIVAHGTRNWGPGLGFDIANAGGLELGRYDASQYTGIAFQVRGEFPEEENSSFRVLFKLQVPASVPTDQGGTCTASDCYNNQPTFGIDNVSATWAQVAIPFDDFSSTVDSSELMGLQWQIEGTGGRDVVMAIDDVGFY